ncbi:uncharacterized protein LOC122319753 [Drosophila ficusphila]|uniref:uncharacterized protein LOC122319753 n=1 Tax=Drosophila ficusphila TaxID=30025 RepID=UPI001C8ACF92|nr:uncharacterized protein LOC122319753 [Drosophila ficusphila]
MSMNRSTNNCSLDVIKGSNTTSGDNNSNEQFDRTENDATHPILRSDHRHQGELVLCLTCHKQFKSFSFSDICAHFIYTHPNRQNSATFKNLYKCLYCKRDIHYFLRAEKSDPEIYHFCSPRKKT